MAIVAILLMCLGFLGCFVNKIPGPLLAFIGLLLAKFAADLPISWGIIILCAVLVAASMVVNAKYVPRLAAKIYPFGKGGKWGTFTGSLIGLIIALKASAVVGIIFMLALPYGFAWLFEYLGTKDSTESTKRATSAFTVYLASTVIKLAVVYLCFNFTINNMADNILG